MKINSTNVELVFKSKACSVETMELKGYSLIVELFCDSSGFGSPDEPALTLTALIDELKRITNERGTVYTAITGQGQFQVYVGVFQKLFRDKKAKIVGANTLEIVEGDKRIIRLYDTNIITFEPGKITLNTGGFNTLTTGERMREFLPEDWTVSRKDWNFQAINIKTGKTILFVDDMAIIDLSKE